MQLNTKIASRLYTEAQMLRAERERIDREYRTRTTALAAMVGDQSGQHTVVSGDTIGTFTVSENNTYDADQMVATLKPGQVRRCSKWVLDKSVVKRLYPAVYAAAKRPNGVKVTF